MARFDEFSSRPLVVEIKKSQVKRLRVKGYPFSCWVLPGIAVLVPVFHFLITEHGLGWY